MSDPGDGAPNNLDGLDMIEYVENLIQQEGAAEPDLNVLADQAGEMAESRHESGLGVTRP